MARARVFVFLVFIASETLVLVDSIPLKVPVRDEIGHAKESNKQKPSISNSRIDVPPNKGAFRIIKSVTSTVSSSISGTDGEHNNKKITNSESSAALTDEDPDKGNILGIPEEQFKESSSDVFNFDEFLISVTSKNELQSDSHDKQHNQSTNFYREPMKPIPIQIRKPELDKRFTHSVVSSEENIEGKSSNQTANIKPSFSMKNEIRYVDSAQSEASQVNRRRPSVKRKNRKIPTTRKPSTESKIPWNSYSEIESQSQDRGNTFNLTPKIASKSRSSSRISENSRRKLFPSRRYLVRGIARKMIPMAEKEKERGTEVDNNINTITNAPLTTLKPFTTTTTFTTIKLTSIQTENNESADADYLSYGNKFDPAPPQPRYTLTPKVLNNVIVKNGNLQPTATTAKARMERINLLAHRPKGTSLLLEFPVRSDLADNSLTALQVIPTKEPTIRRQTLMKSTPFAGQLNVEDRRNQKSLPDLTDSKGNKAVTHRDVSARPGYFDYTDYEDLVEYNDYPEERNFKENSGGNIYDNFQYGFKVAEKVTENYQVKAENRDGDKISGTYEVALPDGRIQLVNYIANDEGFQAEVTYKNENENSPATLSKVAPLKEKEKITAGLNKNTPQLSNPRHLNTMKKLTIKAKKAPTVALNSAVTTELIKLAAKNSHMTPYPASQTSDRTPQRLRGKSSNSRSKGKSIVNQHFHSPTIIQNHPFVNNRPEPIPRPIPSHGQREIARVPPNPFSGKNKKKKSHTPIRPQPKLISTIPPNEPPVHPLLQPGVFNRPVHFDHNRELNFENKNQALPFLSPHSSRKLSFQPPPSPFKISAPSFGIGQIDLAREHLDPPIIPFHIKFSRRKPIGFNEVYLHEPVFPETPFTKLKQLQVKHRKKSKIDFTEDFSVTTPSANPFKVVVERIRPSTYHPSQAPFAVFTTPASTVFPFDQTSTIPFLNQQTYIDLELRSLPNKELLKTSINEQHLFGHPVHLNINSQIAIAEEALFPRTNLQPILTFPNKAYQTTTPKSIFAISNESHPTALREQIYFVSTTEGPPPTTPLSRFHINKLKVPPTTATPLIQESNYPMPTPVPYSGVTAFVPYQPVTTRASPTYRIISTPAPFETTSRSRPLFFKYPSKTGTPTPTLVYHPNYPAYIHAAGQTHAIPLLLPFEGSASENSEVKTIKTLHSENAVLHDKTLNFNKSDIYPEPPPRST